MKASRRGSPRSAASNEAGIETATACLDAIDRVLRHDRQTVEDVSAYVELNAQFHVILVGLSGSQTLARQLERATALPFASPSALVQLQSSTPEAQRILTVAQDQHRCVVDAIVHRESGRAEAIMREHARLAHRNLERAFANQRMELVPGAALIRRRLRAGGREAEARTGMRTPSASNEATRPKSR